MRGKIVPLLLILLFAMGLGACGNKGPLTLPDEDEKNSNESALVEIYWTISITKTNALYCEDVAISTLAETYGTPLYVYSRATLERHWHAFDAALAGRDHLVCYAVKANSNLAVLNVLARLGSGFDIVSGGELQRVLRAGGDPNKIVFSGVGKLAEEMELALESDIHCFNVESEQELDQLNAIAARNQRVARVSFRVNPDVDAKTHPVHFDRIERKQIWYQLRGRRTGLSESQGLVAYRCRSASIAISVHS